LIRKKKNVLLTLLTLVFLIFSVSSVYATIPSGTVVFSNGQALDLTYANNATHQSEVTQDVVNSNGGVYVINFSSSIVNNSTSAILTPTQVTTLIPAVIYKDDHGNVEKFDTGNGAEITNDVISGTSASTAFGSMVTVNITNPATYVGATQFQVYVNGVAASALATLNTATTVYPAQTTGAQVQVEFFNAAGTKIGTTQNVTLTYTTPVTSTPTPTPTPVTASSADTMFSFDFLNNPSIRPEVTYDSDSITAIAPYETDLTSLTPEIYVSNGATVSPASGVPQDFTHPVNYTVTAQDGSTKVYTVTITDSSADSITSIAFPTRPDLPDFFYQLQSGSTNLTEYLEAGTPVTSATPTIVVSNGATISPASGVTQDFSHPVTYTVTGQDGSTKVYTITMNVATQIEGSTLSSADSITRFIFPNNPSIQPEIMEEADAINATVPFGTNLTSLTPDVDVSPGATVSPGWNVPQNFTNPVNYTVTAQDGTKKTYTVTITTQGHEGHRGENL